MPSIHQPGRPIQHPPEIVAVAQLRLPGVDPHPDSQRRRTPLLLTQCPLHIKCRPHRFEGGREHGIAPITGHLHNMTVMRSHRLPEQLVVAGQRRTHLLTMLLPQPRRTLHIAKEKRHSASRKRGHHKKRGHHNQYPNPSSPPAQRQPAQHFDPLYRLWTRPPNECPSERAGTYTRKEHPIPTHPRPIDRNPHSLSRQDCPKDARSHIDYREIEQYEFCRVVWDS